MVFYIGSLPDARGYQIMLDSIKNELHLRLDELFAEAAVDSLSGDIGSYKDKLSKIVQIANVLEVDTKINYVTVDLKDVSSK